MADPAQVSSAATLVLVDKEGDAHVSSGSVLVLWGLDSEAQVSSGAVLVLGRRKGRRIIGITD